MNTFNSLIEELDFLKKYKLVAPTETTLPTFYYFAPGADTPCVCEIIGYEDVYEGWAVITIKANNNIINIHSSYLLEMKKRGREFYRHNSDSSSNTYIVFDIETTGYNHKTDKIIEIAALKVSDDSIEEFSELVKIEDIIPIHITSLTGITNEMVYDASPISEVLPRFLDFIEEFPLVGHNIKAFDYHCIDTACKDLDLPSPKNKLIDTLPLSKQVLPELADHKLSTLCEYYGMDTAGAHRALFDCHLCNDLYRILTHGDDAVSDTGLDVDLSETPFQMKILSILDKIISEKELPEKGLRLRKNKNRNIDTYSILISEPPYPLGSERLGGEQSVMKISLKADSYDIDILLSVFENITLPDSASYKILKQIGDSPQHVSVSFPINDSKFYNYVESVILYRLAHYRTAESTFSCCSQFIQCSDAQKCVHENKLYSTACTYRRNLESGRIFYGKNRNID